MLENITFLDQINRAVSEITRISELDYQYNPRELVFEIDKVKLYHYRSKRKKINAAPLLVVFATVNRPEILDIFPETSFIGNLLKNGVDVYLLDWGYPNEHDNYSFNDYVTHYLNACVLHILKKSKLKKINLLGICQGGVMCLCYSILFKHIKNLILISAPIDFHTPENVVGSILKRIDIDSVFALFHKMPGWWLTQFFIALRPFELLGIKYLRFIDQIDDPIPTGKFLLVEKWLNDAPDQTAQSFTELTQDLYKDNKLIKNQFYLGENKIELSHLTIPVLNIMAETDEIVPVSASQALKKYVKSRDYTEKYFPSGHIGIYVSTKVGNKMTDEIANWLKKRK